MSPRPQAQRLPLRLRVESGVAREQVPDSLGGTVRRGAWWGGGCGAGGGGPFSRWRAPRRQLCALDQTGQGSAPPPACVCPHVHVTASVYPTSVSAAPTGRQPCARPWSPGSSGQRGTCLHIGAHGYWRKRTLTGTGAGGPRGGPPGGEPSQERRGPRAAGALPSGGPLSSRPALHVEERGLIRCSCSRPS